ncbi:MAG: carboxynorspermidine decarboxylase [Candidatus Competibacteraceae bacterium]|nr:carboxynorspermidine decarboxylase [Candidatus Competibacteraceae bacterium]
MAKLTTPYYLIDENRLRDNLEIIRRIRDLSGAKFVLALKCFSTWGVFDLMRDYLDGTTSSSLFEARLGYEKFGKEVHAYSVGFSEKEVKAVRKFADKVIFNSMSQFRNYHHLVRDLRLGLRVNPGISYSHFDLADPARRYSRLGVTDRSELMKAAPLLSGVMFHFNCENDDFANIAAAIDRIGENYGALLERLDWVSLGGGLYFTKAGYPVERFAEKLKSFAEKFGVQLYLEPGEAAITQCAELVTTVVDVIRNEIEVAIVDASVEAHMLDHLIYRTSPKLAAPEPGRYRVIIAGRTCLAGDVFGEYKLKTKLKVGGEVRIADAAGYTMVKKNWFNGLAMPAIAVRRLDGRVDVIRKFRYKDFKRTLS